MADDTTTNARVMSSVRDLLPSSASIIKAFRKVTSSDNPGHVVLDIAADLASHHQRQWHAENASRAVDISAEDVAACKQLIDELNAERVALVERIDTWVIQQIHGRVEASLHTETLGSVVDRLAIGWVRASNLTHTDEAPFEKVRVALRQLAELADAYDDLIRDVAAGHRRLPAWRPLKSYRAHT